VEVLIRKYQNKKGEELRKNADRRPIGPNVGLSAKQGLARVQSPICAAELKDQGEVFKHLVNTSLLTAPLFYQQYEQDLDMLHMWNYQ